MSQELFLQTAKMFDTPDKWNSYLELAALKEKLIEHWYRALKRAMTHRFLHEDIVNGWAFNTWGLFDAEWYLEEFGKNSVILLMGWWGEMNLIVNSPDIDKAETKRLLSTTEFAPLLSNFNRIDAFYQDHRMATERRNFSFGSPYDEKFNYDNLAWFAGNRTNEFVDQIAEKVNRFRKNPEMTQLLSELNRRLKK